MTFPVLAIVEKLKDIGYDVYLEGEKVRYKYLGLIDPPQDKVIPLLQEIKTHKSEALECLREGLLNHFRVYSPPLAA